MKRKATKRHSLRMRTVSFVGTPRQRAESESEVMGRDWGCVTRVWQCVSEVEFFLPRRRSETYRAFVNRNLEDSNAGVVLDVLMIIASLIMVGMFMVVNWQQAVDGNEDEPAWADTWERVMGALFTAEYCVRFFASEHRRQFFCR